LHPKDQNLSPEDQELVIENYLMTNRPKLPLSALVRGFIPNDDFTKMIESLELNSRSNKKFVVDLCSFLNREWSLLDLAGREPEEIYAAVSTITRNLLTIRFTPPKNPIKNLPVELN
jgi:hypothetical protein